LIQEVILAAIPNPASVNETEAISDPDQPVQPTLIEDEDPNEEVVNDLDVIAEVKLSSTVRKFNSSFITHFLLLNICNRA